MSYKPKENPNYIQTSAPPKFGVFDFLQPKKANGEYNLDIMNDNINNALTQSQNAFNVAKAAWNNQIEYFKVSFTEIDKRQKNLASAISTLTSHIKSNTSYINRYSNEIKKYSTHIKYFLKLAKAIVNAIVRIARTFSDMSSDYRKIETESKNLASSFGSLASNVGKLKPIR